MKKIVLICLCFFVSSVHAMKCPSTDTELTQFRDLMKSHASKKDYKKVRSEISKCFTYDVDNHPACLDEVSMLANRQLGGWGRDQIFSEASKQMSYERPEQAIPEEFLLLEPKGCQVGSADCRVVGLDFPFRDEPDGAEKMKKLFDSKNWPWAMYRTRSSGGFDGSPNLTIVAIPGKERDIFLQISPERDPTKNYHQSNVDDLDHMHKGTGTLTVITVDKTQDPPVGEMRLMRRTNSKGYEWNNTSRAQSCFRCHSNPLRKISPRGWKARNRFTVLDCDDAGVCKNKTKRESRMKPDMVKRVDRINAMMPGNLRWDRAKMKINGKDALDHVGPDLSLSAPTGWVPENYWSDEKIKECVARTPEEKGYHGFAQYEVDSVKIGKKIEVVNGPSKKRNEINLSNVRKAMNCTQCHNGDGQAWLHNNMDDEEIYFKIAVDRQMPPLSHGVVSLTLAERFVISQCLGDARRDKDVREAWELNKPWLSSVACKMRKTITKGQPTEGEH